MKTLFTNDEKQSKLKKICFGFFYIVGALMRFVSSRFLCLCLLVALSACSSPKEVDLRASPYTQAATIRDNGGTYKVGNAYQIMGQWYYPEENYNYSEEGTASWYGDDFHAKTTANGEEYDMNSLTAAHRTLPLPSIVRVTNLENGRSLVLRVNDRGPYAKNRIIDVSKRAAELLGFKTKGTAKVRVEILPKESLALKQALLEQDFEPNYGLYSARDESFSSEVPPPADTNPEYLDRNVLVGAGATVPQTTSAPKVVANVSSTASKPHVAAGGKKFYVQAGAFSKQASALSLSKRLASFGEVQTTAANINGSTFYRVRLGPYNAQDEALRAANKLNDYGFNDTRIVKD